MKCSFCGNEIPDTAKFCPNCGTKVEIPEQPVEEPAEQQEYNRYEEEKINTDIEKPIYEDPNKDVDVQSHASEYSYGQQSGSDYTYSGYNYNDNMGGGYNSTMNNEPKVSGTPYIIFGILVTLCCCLPLGIATIVLGSKIESHERAGNHAAAKKCAKTAMWTCIIGAVGGLILSIALGVFGTVGAVTSGEIESITESIIGDSEEEDEEDIFDESEISEAVPFDGTLGDTWDSFTLTINNKLILLPCTPGEIEAVGLKPEDGTDMNKQIDQESYEQVFYENKDGNYLLVTISNESSEPKKMSDCKVTGIYADGSNQDLSALNMKYPGEVALGDEIDAFIAKWGETEDVYEDDDWTNYSWFNDDFHYCTVMVDNKTNQVISIDLDCGNY